MELMYTQVGWVLVKVYRAHKAVYAYSCRK